MVLTFKQFVQLDEQSLLKALMKKIYGGETTANWFDLDDLLVKHDENKGAKVNVVDNQGNHIQSLTTSQYNSHVEHNMLQPNQHYDYKQFADSNVFANSAHPIRKMINHAQRLLDNGHFVHIITARSDMDNPQVFLGALKQMGLNTDHPRFHLHRAGNFVEKNPTHINKAKMLDRMLTDPRFGLDKVRHVVGYDDHKPNVTSIYTTPIAELGGKTIRQRHPNKEFAGIHFTKGRVKRVS